MQEYNKFECYPKKVLILTIAIEIVDFMLNHGGLRDFFIYLQSFVECGK